MQSARAVNPLPAIDLFQCYGRGVVGVAAYDCWIVAAQHLSGRMNDILSISGLIQAALGHIVFPKKKQNNTLT